MPVKNPFAVPLFSLWRGPLELNQLLCTTVHHLSAQFCCHCHYIPETMPSRRVTKNGTRGSHQVHMNKVKFDPYRYKLDDEKVPASVLARMTSLCCRRCCDILQWKVDYGKYAQLQRRKKCNHCGENSISHAYHHICQTCAATLRCCAKCQKPPGTPYEATTMESSGEDTEDCDSEGDPHGDASVPRQGGGTGAMPVKRSSCSNFLFVDREDSDEDLKPLRGLDIRQLKASKQANVRQQERERLGRLRERERRTILRRSAKGPGCDDEDDDSIDEE
ncbi:hypothetical protein, conserved [Trypanosoma brucei brucei TREU927]|uniref:Uncharacterized protein n=1 Tax=Trypanosoma brucei brucei (strain 927/4 GUTat10.1) TaxID=185431 RepID=Q585H8_TRYB2|nr:hypothetical protein, conserved [Trypanosoma brucei brucei TREU927]AAX79227.1 hypothetical protein, conserved [Trypanosoma brucei]AAZ10963.1 hypothetical protein, conserved [Trypanosoma brucei brucei TREU927]